jgi:HK97 family phage major capsid protein
MATEVLELTQKMDQVIDLVPRVKRLESCVFSRGQENSTVIQKGLRQAGPAGGMFGAGFNWDGADEMGFFRNSEQFNASRYGSRQKAIGRNFGKLFQDIVTLEKPDWCIKAGGYETVMKRLTDGHCAKPIKKSALAESQGSLGGYTMPVQFYMELLRLMAEESFTRQLVTVIPMLSGQLIVPALLQSLGPPTGPQSSAFFGGIQASWQPEAATINQTNPNFREINLVARNLVYTVVASNQLLQDNAVALDTLLTTMFKEVMAWCFDYFILQGIGTTQPLGLLNAAATLKTGPNSGGRTTTGKVIFDDILWLYSKMLPSSYKTCVWVIHPSVLYYLFRATVDATSNTPSGVLAFLPSYPSDNMGSVQPAWVPQILGRPVIVTEKVPAAGTAGDVMLVDFSKYLVGDRMAVQIEASPHVLFQTNQLMWRVIQRWDGQPWLDKPITLADNSYTVSPYIALN